jgi:hypothetical protein
MSVAKRTVALIVLVLFAAQAFAGERIPQSVTIRRTLKAYLSSDHVSKATGVTIAITISKNGGAFANPSGGATNATEIANGWYYVDLTTTDTNTLGPLIVRGTSATIDDAEPDPYDVVDANSGGLGALPTVATGNAGAVITSGTGTAQLSTSSGQVLQQAGTGAGQISMTSGVVDVNVKQALGNAVTTTTNGILDVNTKNINNVAAATPGASGGILIAGSNAATTFATLTSTGALTVNGVSNVSQTGDSYARIGAAGAGLTGITGVTLAASQPGVTIPTVTTVTNQLTAAQIASGVFKDTVASDFTTVGSIGASLAPATLGTAPGASGGLFIAGTNAATTVNFTGNLSGSVGSVTSAVTLPAIPANWITAAGINAAALNGKGDWLLSSSAPANFSALGITAGGHVSNVDTLTTYTGNTPQTGDSFARIGANGAGLTAITGVTLAASQPGVTIPTVTTLTNLPSITPNWLTATGIAAGALNGKGDWLLSSGYTVPPTAAAIQAAVFSGLIDNTYSLQQYLSLMGGTLAGTTTGGPSAPAFKRLDGSKVVVTGTVDANGNRSAMTLSP